MNENELKPNPYASPQSSANADAVGFRLSFAFISAIFLTTLLPIVVGFTRSPAIRGLADFEVELPVLTRLALSTFFFLLTCCLPVITIAKEVVAPRGLSRMANIALVGLAICLGVGYILAVWLAYLALIQNLQ